LSALPQPQTNPARLSRLAALFSPPVVVAEITLIDADGRSALLRDASALLSRREWESIRRCAEARILDFCAGRLCARRALAEFGMHEFELLSAPDRQPLWPSAVTGSITHTEGFSAAVVGARDHIAGLGIDAERVSAVHQELWPSICAPEELERLQALPVNAQLQAAALTFTAKEAFFKCQYPLAAERFDFAEVQLRDADWQSKSGEFEISWRTPSKLDGFLPAGTRARVQGRFERREQFLTAGLAMLPV
jgi:4'-phosphopantetheinyl transferase EntD